MSQASSSHSHSQPQSVCVNVGGVGTSSPTSPGLKGKLREKLMGNPFKVSENPFEKKVNVAADLNEAESGLADHELLELGGEEDRSMLTRIFEKVEEFMYPDAESRQNGDMQEELSKYSYHYVGGAGPNCSNAHLLKPRTTPRSPLADKKRMGASVNSLGASRENLYPAKDEFKKSGLRKKTSNPEDCEWSMDFVCGVISLSVCNKKGCLYRFMKVLIICLLILITLFLLTLMICKRYMDAERFERVFYGKCYTPKEHLDSVRKQMEVFSASLEKENLTYWVDYGTALGAWREKDIILWDHDADMSFFEKDQKKVERIYSSLFGGKSGGDINRYYWKEQNGMLRRIHRGLFSPLDAFNSSYVEHTETCEFGTFHVQCPRDLGSFVKVRFPHTWNMKISYRPSCVLNNVQPFVD
eukprot:Nk52_evm52s554 gene=Nk52_evmTU52s554